MLRILKWLGIVVCGILVLAAVAYPFRRDPIGPIAGKRLTGEVASATDWAFTDGHMLVKVETRPDDPHSVTTLCFTHEGSLYVPAMDGAGKTWTRYVIEDPRVRIKVGDRIYAGRATRITDPSMGEPLFSAAAAKYPRIAERRGDETPDLERIWVFRIDHGP